MTSVKKNTCEDIPWSPVTTWIVVGVSSSVILIVIMGAALYETLFKPDSFEPLQGKCTAVRGGTYASMEACVNAL